MQKKPSSNVPLSLGMVEFPSMSTVLGTSPMASETVERASRARAARKADAGHDIFLHFLLSLSAAFDGLS